MFDLDLLPEQVNPPLPSSHITTLYRLLTQTQRSTTSTLTLCPSHSLQRNQLVRTTRKTSKPGPRSKTGTVPFTIGIVHADPELGYQTIAMMRNPPPATPFTRSILPRRTIKSIAQLNRSIPSRPSILTRFRKTVNDLSVLLKILVLRKRSA